MTTFACNSTFKLFGIVWVSIFVGVCASLELHRRPWLLLFVLSGFDSSFSHPRCVSTPAIRPCSEHLNMLFQNLASHLSKIVASGGGLLHSGGVAAGGSAGLSDSAERFGPHHLRDAPIRAAQVPGSRRSLELLDSEAFFVKASLPSQGKTQIVPPANIPISTKTG